MNGRIIAIGDVHGCHLEFAELLARLELTRDDRVIMLGDLVNRGPDSNKVLALAREHRVVSLLGNHELRLLKFWRTGDTRFLKEGDLDTIKQLKPDDWALLDGMRLTFEEPELNTVFVHGGFLPNQPWQRQPAEVVTRIQVVGDRGQPAKRADEPLAPSWADLWCGPPFVVYGHTPRPEIYKLKWSVGIDTGCVLGGHLTAYILPEKRFVQVKARDRYWPREKPPTKDAK
jgi:predicted phosphodiesterase